MNVLRGRRIKGLKRRPFMNTGLRSWDSPSGAQTDSGLPAFKSFGRYEVLCKTV